MWWERKRETTRKVLETKQKEWKKGTIKTMTVSLMPVVSCEIATSRKVSFIKNSPFHVLRLFNNLDAIFRWMNPLASQRHFQWLTRTTLLLVLFSILREKKTPKSLITGRHNERKTERKSTVMSRAGLAFEGKKRRQYCQPSFRPQTQNSSFHHNISLSLLFYSIPLLCLCHWTRILSARLSYLHQKCRQPAKGEGGWRAGGEELCWVFLSCSQFKDNWIRDEITSIYVSESCDLIFNSLSAPSYSHPHPASSALASSLMATMCVGGWWWRVDNNNHTKPCRKNTILCIIYTVNVWRKRCLISCRVHDEHQMAYLMTAGLCTLP